MRAATVLPLALLLQLPPAALAQDHQVIPVLAEMPEPAAADGMPAAGARTASAVEVLGQGLASWYGLAFQGRRTASGERFDMNALTAAHPSLPFGTRVVVRNPRNSRWVVVRINDRGPHVPGRIIDLSHAAARSLGLLGLGPKSVVLQVPGPEHAEPAGRRRG